MNIKEQWIDSFMENLWEFHTCDWVQGNKYPNYPFQLAVAYFDWADIDTPEHTVEEAFKRYKENEQ